MTATAIWAKGETMTRINLNERIKVRLTDLGKDIYYHQFDNLNERAGRCVLKPVYPKTDEDGYTEFQLWVFIELYGRHIGMAKPNVIYPNEIVRVEEPTTDTAPVAFKGFAEWVADWILRGCFEECAGGFAELACRRLEDLGIMRKEGNVWVMNEVEE